MKTIGTLSLLFFCFFVNAQRGFQDVVYLKDESIIRGMIIEIVPGQSLKIQTSDMSLFHFEFEEIEKITKELTPRVFDAQKAINQNNFAFFMEPGASVFVADFQGTRMFSFNALAGYRHKNIISIGLTAGVDVGKGPSVIVPVGLGIRGNILPQKSATPFIDFNGGYCYNNFVSVSSGNFFFSVREEPHGAFYSPALGVKYWFSNMAAVTFKVGYYGVTVFGSFSNVPLHAVQLKLGMEF